MEKLVEVQMPTDCQKIVMDRLKPFVEQHLEDERLRATFPLHGTHFSYVPKDLGWLVRSVYIQGLSDGFEMGKNPD
jgi:hypothetical protein